MITFGLLFAGIIYFSHDLFLDNSFWIKLTISKFWILLKSLISCQVQGFDTVNFKESCSCEFPLFFDGCKKGELIRVYADNPR